MKPYRTLFSAVALCVTSVLVGCGGSSDTATNDIPQNSNSAPLANAGNDQTVSLGDTVTLSGEASSDADGDTLTYQWSLLEAPQTSTASVDSIEVAASFVADSLGTYVVQLVVNDGLVDSVAVTVSITVLSTAQDITDKLLSDTSAGCEAYQGEYQSQVMDLQRGETFVGELTIQTQSSTCRLTSNEIPNHDFNDASAAFATPVSAQNNQLDIPTSPLQAGNVTPLSLTTTNGVFLNGATLDLLAAACYGIGSEPLGNEKIGCGQDQIDNPWRYDPMSALNTFGTDAHNAHTQPDGTYHYHGNPQALFDQDCDLTGVPSPVVGFAADGFPIYGSCFTDEQGNVRKALSSYQLKNNGGARQAEPGYQTPQAGVGVVASDQYDGQFVGDWEYQADSGDLDICNGMTVDGQYGYYITDQYPWVMGCFTGTPDPSFDKTGAALVNRMHAHPHRH